MTAQQLATFQVAGCSSNGLECAATSESVPLHASESPPTLPLPASESLPTLTLREIHVEARPGDVMVGAGGRLGLRQTYVTNLQEHH